MGKLLLELGELLDVPPTGVERAPMAVDVRQRAEPSYFSS
jgi:hypothetical protein